jgi:hypothetical protein
MFAGVGFLAAAAVSFFLPESLVLAVDYRISIYDYRGGGV